MAKLTKDNIDNNSQTPISASETVKTVEIPQSTLDNLLERIDSLEKWATEKKKTWVIKERYEWPRKYSYSRRGGIPVLSMESYKKDPSKELLYKGVEGQRISNQYVRLKLANDETPEVEINDFNTNRQRSEKMNCKIMQEEDWNFAYLFETEDFGTISVLHHVIN